jgi:uncharacterized membrane protein
LARQTINIGTTPNDGTGDPIRDAFDKTNQNFVELYSAPVSNTSLTVGNSTVNSFLTEVSVKTGNSTVNTVVNTSVLIISNSTLFSSLTRDVLTVSNTTIVNSTSLFIGNSTVNAVHSAAQLSLANSTTNFTATRDTISVGNSTVNAAHSAAQISLANSTTNFTATRDTISVGNSTVNTSANSSRVSTGSIVVASNTLTLGTSTVAANGYTFLPNGLKLNFGSVEANSSAGQAVFSNAFSTAVYSVTIGGNSVAHDTQVPAVISQTTTAAEIRTTNTSLTKVFYMAIGV